MKYKLKRQSVVNNGVYHYGGRDDHSAIRWALCSAPKTGRIVHQLTGFIYCRESIGCRMFDNMSTSIGHRTPQIPTDRLRLLAKTASAGTQHSSVAQRRKEALDTGTRVALKILNIIEREHKWSLTVAHPVEPYSNGDNIYMFVASKKWMRSPHLLSLFTLLVRLSQQPGLNNAAFKHTRTYKGLMKRLKVYTITTNRDSDNTTVKHTIKFWDMILRNYQKLYQGMPMKRTFDRHNYGSHYDEGIRKLCKNGSSDNVMASRFKKMSEEYR